MTNSAASATSDSGAAPCYVGIKPCGCWRAAVVDCGDTWTANEVARLIREGLIIERVTVPEARVRLGSCPHK